MRYEFVGSGSSNFWQIELSGRSLNVTWGRLGSKRASTRHPQIDDALREVRRSFDRGPGHSPAHRLLGVPRLIQDGMVETLRKRVRVPWRLLLQWDSDRTAKTVWGDAGSLYFWIPEPDLATLRFDRVRCVYQSC